MIWAYVQGILGWLTAGLAASFAIWGLAKRDARKQAELDEARKNLRVSVKSREIENEVQALNPDDLERRASRWVRDAGK